MKLSIVTINRNNATGLEKTMRSVASQTFKEFEYIVVDGASTDGGVDVIKKLESEFAHLKWVSEPDKGIYNAMNKGIIMSSGEYVMILNSSDLIASSTVIEEMLDSLRQCEGTKILLGNIVKAGVKNTKPRRRKIVGNRSLEAVDVSMLTFYRGTIPHDAAFIKRTLFDEYGYYNENMKICSDWRLFLDAIALGDVVPMHVDVDMVLFDMNGISESGGRNAEIIRKERRAYLEEVIPPSIIKDYDRYACDIQIMRRLHRHPIAFKIVHFIERCLFKIEKWFNVGE